MKKDFVKTYRADIAGTSVTQHHDFYKAFSSRYQKLVDKYEDRNLTKTSGQPKVPKAFGKISCFLNILFVNCAVDDNNTCLESFFILLSFFLLFLPGDTKKGEKIVKENAKKKGDDDKKEEKAVAPVPQAEPEKSVDPADAAFQEMLRQENIRKKFGTGGASKGPKSKGSGKKESTVSSSSDSGKSKGKGARNWDGGVSKTDAAKLDCSAKASEEEKAEGDLRRALEEFGAPPEQGDSYASDDDVTLSSSEEEEDSDDEDVKDKQPKKKGLIGGVFSFFQGLAGQKVLERDDLTEVMEQFRNRLMTKNVAAEIADKVCESVIETLVGKKMASMTTISRVVKDAVVDALTRVLTPKKNTDVLQGILEAKAQNRPYTIVFVGVNGVGKSTSLSKVCAYIMSKGFKVGIAACDTFRSGAVEQLRTHARALGVQLYERGYNKDAATVAKESIAQATREGADVVLIDTAGRMQDNEPLMRALAKLVNVNKPDLVLFVGEALVGNDAVDQLTKFNRCMVDFAVGEQRQIDGIILSKFDTVDDKVGGCFFLSSALFFSYHPVPSQCDDCSHHLFLSLSLVCVFVNDYNVCSLGWLCDFDDVHHWPTYRLCRNRADLQGPEENECEALDQSSPFVKEGRNRDLALSYGSFASSYLVSCGNVGPLSLYSLQSCRFTLDIGDRIKYSKRNEIKQEYISNNTR